MTEPLQAITARMSVPEGQYAVSGTGPDADTAIPCPDSIDPTGLMAAGTDGALVITGADYEEITLTVQLWDTPPPLELTPWSDCVEDSYTATGQAYLHDVEGRTPRNLPDLAFAGPGSYRFRLSVRGRDEAAFGAEDAENEAPGSCAEEHLLQIWPAAPAPAVSHKLTDQVGAEWRGSSAER
ncbi:hypothetical protein AB0L53_42635 [Nonomuraea sp. NPDC052129]|uniref:hypothetical protein n=1 Tax=Nonomuraea sp. NPDC052129 TaxID=3154651 RepID=UPI003447F152